MKCPAGDVKRFVRTYRQAPLDAPSCRGMQGMVHGPGEVLGLSVMCLEASRMWARNCLGWVTARSCPAGMPGIRQCASAQSSPPTGRHGGGAATARVGPAPRARDRPDGARAAGGRRRARDRPAGGAATGGARGRADRERAIQAPVVGRPRCGPNRRPSGTRGCTDTRPRLTPPAVKGRPLPQ